MGQVGSGAGGTAGHRSLADQLRSWTDEQISRLAEALKAKTNQDITIRNIVDPAVIGGVVTQIGDSVIDGSVRTRLNQLREAF